VVIFDDEWRMNFHPLTYSRACCELVCGGGSLLNRLERAGGDVTDLWVPDWLRDTVANRHPHRRVNEPVPGPALLLNGRGRWRSIPEVGDGSPWVGVVPGTPGIAAIHGGSGNALTRRLFHADELSQWPRRDVSAHVQLFEWPWQLLHAHLAALEEDLSVMPANGRSLNQPGVHLLEPDRIHIGEGTRIKPCVAIDAESGPVHIGRGVTISAHVSIQGPAMIGDGTLLQVGANVRAGSHIGPVCKVGGEIEGSIIHGWSNKQHDGFLGHSYVGEWVNIAADCINSDLKNTYGTIRMPINGREVETGERFLGMLVGDHCKIGVNCSIPTGAVIGFSSNVIGATAPRFLPSFGWHEEGVLTEYDFDRTLIVAERVMARRDRSFGPVERELFQSIHRQARRLEAERPSLVSSAR
jgi:UDP-N-acetylglucosamine diphosphorylase/glucosamine-1-phosphate N-acetyltransferase